MVQRRKGVHGRKRGASDWSQSVVGTHASGASGARGGSSGHRARTRSLAGRGAQLDQLELETHSVDPRVARYRSGATAAESYARRHTLARRVWLIVSIVAVLGIAAALAFCAFRGQVSSSMALADDSVTEALVAPASDTDPQYILIAGIGDDAGMTTAGFAAVLRMDASNTTASLLVVPTAIPETYSNTSGDYSTLRDAPSAVDEGELITRVSELLDQDINHYVRMTAESFVALVDSLGGITVNVGEYVDDPTAGTLVLYPGEQTLTGAQALVYASAYNYQDGYGQRAVYQGDLFQALVAAINAKGGVSFALSADEVSSKIQTDLSYDELSQLSQLYQTAQLQVATVPGSQVNSSSTPYWSIDDAAWDQVLAGFKGNTSMDTSLDTSNVDKQALSITVLNGAGMDGFSAQAAAVLEAAGYAVGATGNADSFVYDETLVIYRDDEYEAAAEAIVQDLGVGRAVSAGVYYDLGSVDIRVVVGKDWTGGVL